MKLNSSGDLEIAVFKNAYALKEYTFFLQVCNFVNLILMLLKKERNDPCNIVALGFL